MDKREIPDLEFIPLLAKIDEIVSAFREKYFLRLDQIEEESIALYEENENDEISDDRVVAQAVRDAMKEYITEVSFLQLKLKGSDFVNDLRKRADSINEHINVNIPSDAAFMSDEELHHQDLLDEIERIELLSKLYQTLLAETLTRLMEQDRILDQDAFRDVVVPTRNFLRELNQFSQRHPRLFSSDDMSILSSAIQQHQQRLV